MIHMTNTNATNFRKNVFEFLNQAIEYNDVINVNTKNGNAILISEEDYNGMLETLYLNSIPGMIDSIQKAKNEPLNEFVQYDPKEQW